MKKNGFIRRGAGMLTAVMLLAFWAAAVFSFPGGGLTGGAAEAADRVVRVGWYESAFNHRDDRGRRSGYAYEYQMKIAAYVGWRYEYVEGSWPELMEMLKRGEIDLLSDVTLTEERKESMLFPSLPMGAEDYYLFTSRKQEDISSQNYQTLNGRTIGVNRGSVQADYFREWMARQGVECSLTEVTGSEEDSLRMLETGELDGYVTVDSFAENPSLDPDQLMPVCKIGSSEIYFAVAQGRTELLTELNSALERIQEENRYYHQKLFEKYRTTAGANAFLTPEERNWIEGHGPIRVGYQDHYLAFCAADPETGELTGALKDFLAEASQCIVNAPIEFTATAYPTAAEAIEAMRRGEVDCVFPANLTAGDGEENGLIMTAPMMRTDVMAVVRQADRQIFSGQEHVVVAVNEGNPNYESCLREYFPDWHPVYYPTTAECLKAVASRVADCVLISSYRYNNIARQCERDRLTVVDTGAEIDYCLAVNGGNPQLYSILSRVADLVPSTAVNSALSRYISEDARLTLWEYAEDHIWIVVGITLAVLILILILLLRSRRAERKAERLIAATETDTLTGLYNRDFFLQYAARMRQEQPDTPRDAVVINIERFHSVNALNGRPFGDRVLRALAGELRNAARETAGIAGRFEADRFDLYCASQQDYNGLYARLQTRMDALSPSGIRLRMGVMPWRKDMEVVQMFDRARTACALARESMGDHLVIFDNAMQERESYEQRLLHDLNQALDSYEFEVYYQPQYDIQQEPPRPVSAEALVRWNHPKLGMIPPDDFVRLFERHGRIGEVDRFVWGEAARQVARWRDLYGVSVPVSVNLSRVDVFDPALETALDQLLVLNGLEQDLLKLEVTESAYTGNAEQVVQVVSGLRRKGYVVEMDDFGTGYSSLNMLSAMPVDVLKMDRAFIRKIGEGEKENSMVVLILEIARSLKIPVVAEGVETEEQLNLLKRMGCSLVQGFFFSKPLPAAEFEEKVVRSIAAAGKKGEDDSCTR